MKRKQIIMSIETKNENGDVVKEMSFYNANPQILQSVISLLRVGYSCTTSIIEKEIDVESSQG